MTLEEKKNRYAALCHAVQTGVAYQMEKDPDASATSPKHLRTGINIVLVEHSALALLLMEKGIISEDEYWDAVNKAMQEEVERYQKILSQLYGTNITLG